MREHYFAFSTNWSGTDRLCGDCGLTYDDGAHIEITTLKPYTKYVCPSGGGYGHSSVYTGSYDPVGRRLTDHICLCGREFVEEDKETWRLSWEMDTGEGWRHVEHIQSRHASEQQKAGLEELIAKGEPIRNVKLVELREALS